MLKLVTATKICNTCGLEKPVTGFPRQRLLCKVCSNQKRATRAKKAHHNPNTWNSCAVARTRRRARKLGIAFDLVPTDVFLPEYCPVLGLKLCTAEGGVSQSANSPTIDRIIPELGYVRGNIVVISWEANRLKNNGTVEQLERVLAWMKSVGAK